MCHLALSSCAPLVRLQLPAHAFNLGPQLLDRRISLRYLRLHNTDAEYMLCTYLGDGSGGGDKAKQGLGEHECCRVSHGGPEI